MENKQLENTAELLKALIEARQYVEYCCSELNTANDFLPVLNAVIKKASE